MEQVVLIIHLIIAVALVGIILVQRSEGGGLGIGGGQGGMGSFASAAGTASFLTRATAILATCFIGTSLTLTMMSHAKIETKSILDVGITQEQTAPAVGAIEELADKIKEEAPDVPTGQVPSVPTSE